MAKRPKEIRNRQKNLTEIVYNDYKNDNLRDIQPPIIEKRKTPRLLKIDGVCYCGNLACEHVELFDLGGGVLKCGQCYTVYNKGDL